METGDISNDCFVFFLFLQYHRWLMTTTSPSPRFNIKIWHCLFKDKTAVSPSYFNNRNSLIGKTTSLHWDGSQDEDTRCLISVRFIGALDDVEGLIVVYHVSDYEEW